MWRLRVALARLAMLTRGLDTIIAWDLGSIRSDLKKINELFYEVLIAPEYENSALNILKTKKL